MCVTKAKNAGLQWKLVLPVNILIVKYSFSSGVGGAWLNGIK